MNMHNELRELERRYSALLEEIQARETVLDGLYSELYSIEHEIERRRDLDMLQRSTAAWKEARGI